MILIKDWHLFQHYKDRNPPWIKLYRSLLDNEEYRQLDPFARSLLLDLWLLASESKIPGAVDMKPAKLAWRLRDASTPLATFETALQAIQHQGFITVASETQAKCLRDALPETETETETKAETETEPPAWLAAVWQEFLEHRRAMRRPLTGPARKRLLAKCVKNGPATVNLLEQTIENGWLTVQWGKGDARHSTSGNGHDREMTVWELQQVIEAKRIEIERLTDSRIKRNPKLADAKAKLQQDRRRLQKKLAMKGNQ